ncbi:hypothetical protein ILYODFUR_036015 [Ilyodon furcidens]|uniref:Uncharacterized protein n=1 Tax=Ilyodon furcidens TaxID=33524 RepID=A0ABV0U1P6_9TELE
MDVIHSLTLPMHTLYSQVQVPVHPRGNQRSYPGGGPLPSWAETGRQRRHRPDPGDPGPAPAPPTPNPVPNNPDPPLERGVCTKEGSKWLKPARKLEPPQDSAVQTPQ